MRAKLARRVILLEFKNEIHKIKRPSRGLPPSFYRLPATIARTNTRPAQKVPPTIQLTIC
jgi:hypothetical protein